MREQSRSHVRFEPGVAPVPNRTEPTVLLPDPQQLQQPRLATWLDRMLDRLQAASPYDQVPSDYRPTVDQLISMYYPYYEVQYPRESDFANDVALNWLGKVRAFPEISRGFGLRPATHARISSADDNRVIAMLTANASFLILGPGALSTGGTNLEYRRMPLRGGDVIADVAMPKGGRLLNLPKGGDVAELQIGPNNARDRIFTSPIISIWKGKPNDSGACMQGFERTIPWVTTLLNQRTFNRPR